MAGVFSDLPLTRMLCCLRERGGVRGRKLTPESPSGVGGPQAQSFVYPLMSRRGWNIELTPQQ